MTAALFLGRLGDARIGGRAWLEGAEARHAAVVKRIGVGETIRISDGSGTAVEGPVLEVAPERVVITIDQVLTSDDGALRWTVVQALAKGERQELAIELLTEVGVDQIWAWQSHRSIVRWDGPKATKGLGRWQATAREAAKQSRRAATPVIGERVLSSKALIELVEASAALVLVLHEDADLPIEAVELTGADEVMLIVGPEGGISPDELTGLTAAGARPVSISDGVLRTSTAGAVGLVQLQLLHRLAVTSADPATTDPSAIDPTPTEQA